MTEQIQLYEKQELVNRIEFIPKIITHLFGCNKCYWRYTDKCPNYDKEAGKMDWPKEGICSRRQGWILSFVPSYEKRPTQSTFMLDLNKGMGYQRQEIEKAELERYEELKAVYEKDTTPDEEAIRKIDNKINKLKSDWKYTWTQLMKFEDAQVTRETPKQVKSLNVVITPKPSDVTAWMKEAKDAEDGE